MNGHSGSSNGVTDMRQGESYPTINGSSTSAGDVSVVNGYAQ